MADVRAPGEPTARARQDGEWGSWEDARRRKITLGLGATPAERLAWLEAAIELAHASGALPRRPAESPVAAPRLQADFNGLFGDLLCLSHGDTAPDETGMPVPLSEGMTVTVFDEDVDEHGARDDLVAHGVVERSPPWLACKGSRWVLRIDERGVMHASAESRR